MTTEQLAALREVAEKATPGPWEVVAADDYFVEAPNVMVDPPKYVDANLVRPGICKVVCEVSNQTHDCGEANAIFISAFDPTTCLELVEEVERLRTENIQPKEHRNDLIESVEVLEAR